MHTKDEAAKLSATELFELSGRITDAEVLRQTGRGKFGAGIVGVYIAERSHRLLAGNPGGQFGPAILDPDHAKKQVAKAAQQLAEDAALDDDTLYDRYVAEAVAVGANEDQADDIAQRKLKRVHAARRHAGLDEHAPHTKAQATAARDQAQPEYDPADLDDERNPWSTVTLSGAKQLAQKHGVSYKPRVTRVDLIAALQAAGVEPPAPAVDDTDDADEDRPRRGARRAEDDRESDDALERRLIPGGDTDAGDEDEGTE